MKKQHKAIWIIIIVLLINVSCSKEPSSDFTFSVDSTTEGKVIFFNSSSNASSYVWDFGDGSSSHETNPVHYYQKNGTYTVDLRVKSSNGSTSNSSRIVSVTSVKGYQMFWTSSNLGLIDVYVSGLYQGTINMYYPSGVSNCGSSGCVTVKLPAGVYLWSAGNSSGDQWSGNITISSGQCSKMQLIP